jgi:hypothetical protein
MRLGKKHTILFALIIIAVAVVINQQILAQTYTYKPFYDNIINYCFNNVDKILAGQNPVKDLTRAGLIPRHFDNMTCTDVTNEAIASPDLAENSVENKNQTR